MTNPLGLSGRRILITGASSGIGRDIAVIAAELGARTVLVGRNPTRLEETRTQLVGSEHLVEPFDLTDADSIPALIKRIVEQGGPFNGIVHAAGIQTTMALRAVDSAVIDKVMRTNVYSALMLARGLNQRNCADTPASLVIISSIMGLVGRPTLSVYSASKAAVAGMVKSLALELAPRIRVNCISPAFVRSEMTARLETSLSVEQFQELEGVHPLGLGSVRDVSHAAMFLLADTGRWITGTNLVVDGGYSAR